MIGTLLSYLVVYLLGGLSLYVYQTFFAPKKKTPYVPRPLPTFGVNDKTPTPPSKPTQDTTTKPTGDGGMSVVRTNSRVLVPIEKDTAIAKEDGKDKEKSAPKEEEQKGEDKTEQKESGKEETPNANNNEGQDKGKEKEDDAARQSLRHSRKASTMREGRRYAKPPALPSNDRFENIVIGSNPKRALGDTTHTQGAGVLASTPPRGVQRTKSKEMLSQSTPALKNTGMYASSPIMLPSQPQQPPSPHLSKSKKESKKEAKKRVATLKSFNPTKERLVEYKRGWMDIRSLKKYNRRYFILYSGLDGNWLTYFKDEKMKRAECYGHVVLTGSCTVRLKNDSDCAFVIHHSTKLTVFSSKGPFGLIASSSHRMFHGKSAKCVLRADDPSVATKWIEKIKTLCSDTPVAGASLLAASSPSLHQKDSSEEEASTVETGEDGSESDFGGNQINCRQSEKNELNEEEEIEENSEKEIENENDEENEEKDFLEKSSGYDEGGSGEEDENLPENNLAVEPVYYPYQWPEEEKNAIVALQDHAKELLESQGCLRDEYFLWRFLKARAFDVEATSLMLENYFRWRASFHPERITLEDVMDEVVKKKIHFNGYDNNNRPILMVYAANHNPKESSLEMLIKFACFVIETAVKKMTLPVQTYSLIVDMSGFGLSNVDYSVAKEAAALFQDVYPERLGVLMCVNCPFIVNVVWGVVKAMLDDRTKRKVNFLKNGKELIKTGIFPLKWIPKHLGGECEYVCPVGSVGLETLEM